MPLTTPDAPASLPAHRLALLRAVLAGEQERPAAPRVVRELRAALETLDPVGSPGVALADREAVALALLEPTPIASPAARAWADRLEPTLAALVPAAPAEAATGEDGRDGAAPAADPVPAEARPAAPDLPERPTLAEGVVVDDPAPAADHRVVHVADAGVYLRVKLAQAAFIEGLDGTRTVDELVHDAEVPAPVVVPLLAKLASIGLLEGTRREGDDGPPGRLRMTGPTIQYTVLDPARALDRARPAIALLRHRSVRAGLALLVLAGLVSFAANLDTSLLSLDRVTDPIVLVTLVLAVVATTVVHELGHAVAVTAFGGRVRRMGLMLFYLMPAMFCDASDSWRFPYPWQRAVVAASGVAAQLVLVSVVALVLWAGLPDGLQAWLLLFVGINLSMAVYNMIPLVKLDGYWMLSSLLDRPNMREGATALAGAWTKRLTFGVPVPPEARRPRPGILLLGLACAAFGPALVLYVLLGYQEFALEAGVVGAVVWLGVLLVVLSTPALGLWRILAGLRAQGRTRAALRGGATLVAIAAVVAVLLAVVPVDAPTSGTGGRDRTESLAAHLWDARGEPVLSELGL